MSVRVIFCLTELVEVDRKLYRELVSNGKFDSRYEFLSLLFVKFTRIDII